MKMILSKNVILMSNKGHYCNKLTNNGMSWSQSRSHHGHYQSTCKIWSQSILLKILGWTKILRLISGHKSVTYGLKFMCNNPNLDYTGINAYIKFGQNPSIRAQDEILTSIKSHNSVTNLVKLMCNNSNLDHVSINAYAKFGQNPSFHCQDIEQKRNSDVNEGP